MVKAADADSDKDGFSDSVEKYAGTDPADGCADNNNDAAWPPDFDNDGIVSIGDINSFIFPTRIRKYGTSVGNKKYNPRWDLNADGSINMTDIQITSSYFNIRCK